MREKLVEVVHEGDGGAGGIVATATAATARSDEGAAAVAGAEPPVEDVQAVEESAGEQKREIV